MQMVVTMLLVAIALVYIVRRYWPTAYRIGVVADLRRVSQAAPSVAPKGACGSGCNACSGCGRIASGTHG